MVYVTSDLHGYPLEKFRALLAQAGFSKDDKLFVLGDVIDRGPQGVALLRWMMERPNVSLIMGNHEAMLLSCSFIFEVVTEEMLEAITQQEMVAFEIWCANGGETTLKELFECGDTRLQVLDYVKKAPLYVTVRVNGRDFLLVHGGLGGFDLEKPLEEYSFNELLWTRPDITQTYNPEVITIFGHTPTKFYGEEYCGKAIKTETWINIDTGAACGGAPMLLRLDDMKEFYAQNV